MTKTKESRIERRMREDAEKVRTTLIKAGIKNLTEFGYTGVTDSNIITEYVLRKFFRSMLEETLEEAPQFKKHINALIAEIDAKGEC